MSLPVNRDFRPPPLHGCTGAFMRENAICQHRRDSTYTVPYVPADWICAARDHETRRLAERRSAAGMARRRFDLKGGLQAIRLSFDIPAPSTCVKRRRAIPTFGSRQAPRHEPGFARHEYPRISQLSTLFPRCVFLDRINRIYKILAVCKCFLRFYNPDNPVNPVQKKFCNCRK